MFLIGVNLGYGKNVNEAYSWNKDSQTLQKRNVKT